MSISVLMSCFVLKLVREADSTGFSVSCSMKVGLCRATAALPCPAFSRSSCFSFPFTLSEVGIAGALSHRAFLDLDFLAVGCKREGESDLVGEVDVCEAVAAFGA